MSFHSRVTVGKNDLAFSPVFRVPKPTDKILLALQFWEGDKDGAYRLAKLLADIEPGHNSQAEFLFVHRFDCKFDQNIRHYVSRKFNTHVHHCKRRGVGWPQGCNELWLGTMEWIYHNLQKPDWGSPYKAVFTLEGDGAPLCSNWISRLSTKWDEIQPAYVAGHYIADHPRPHINGNALFSCHPAFLKWLATRIHTVNASAGWDYYLTPLFKQWGQADIPEIRSYWSSQTMSDEWFANELRNDVVWVHGVKDDSLHRQVSKLLLFR